jgi:hypothetical protein
MGKINNQIVAGDESAVREKKKSAKNPVSKERGGLQRRCRCSYLVHIAH